MASLINQLDKSVGKTAFQIYTIEHGIDRISVQVPLKQVPLFEQKFLELQDKRKSTIISLVVEVGGKVRG